MLKKKKKKSTSQSDLLVYIFPLLHLPLPVSFLVLFIIFHHSFFFFLLHEFLAFLSVHLVMRAGANGASRTRTARATLWTLRGFPGTANSNGTINGNISYIHTYIRMCMHISIQLTAAKFEYWLI